MELTRTPRVELDQDAIFAQSGIQSTTAGLLLGVSWSDGNSITATSSAGELIPENMLDLQPARRWRSVGLGDAVIDSNWGWNAPVNMVVLAGNNLSLDSSVCIDLYDDSGKSLHDECNTGEFHELGWGIQPLGEMGLGGVYVVEDRDPAGYIDTDYVVFVFPTVMAAGIRIAVSDDINPAGFMEIGRLKVGRALEVDYTPGYEMGWRDTSSLTRTRGGALRSNNGRSYRYVNVNAAMKDDQTELSQLFRNTGLTSDVVWSGFGIALSNEGRENLILGRLTTYGASNWTNEGVTTSFSIEEAI
jgi:hypothetical protein